MATDLGQPRGGKTSPARYEAFARGQLARMETRIRALDLTAAVLAFAAGTLAFVLLMMFVDRRWELTAPVRQGAFLLYVIGSVLFLVFAVGRPLRRRVNPYYAALKLEETLPEAKNSVINWVDLHHAELAPAITAALGQRAARDLARADLDHAVSGKKAGWAGGLAAVFFGLFLTAFVLFGPRQFLSLLWRSMLPFESGGISSQTVLNIVRPEGGNASVAIDRSVMIAAQVLGRLPDPKGPNALRLLYRYQENDPFLERPLQRESGDEWAITLSAAEVQNGFWYKVAGGDAETAEYRIAVRSRPLLTDFRATYQFRPYTGRPAELRRARPLEAVRGTEVALRLRTNRPVQEAFLELGSGSSRKRVRADRVAGDAQCFETRLTLEESTPYKIHYDSTDGESYSDPVDFPITVHPDKAPVVDLTKPGKDVTLPANGVLSLEGNASDDFGVKAMVLRLQVDDGRKLKAQPYRSEKALRLPSGGHPAAVAYKDFVDLARAPGLDGKPLPLAVGQKLEYWLEATDACDYPRANTGTSKHFHVTIGQPENDPARQQQARKKAEEDKQQHDAKQDEQNKKEDQERQDEARQRKEEIQKQDDPMNKSKDEKAKGEQPRESEKPNGTKEEKNKQEENQGGNTGDAKSEKGQNNQSGEKQNDQNNPSGDKEGAENKADQGKEPKAQQGSEPKAQQGSKNKKELEDKAQRLKEALRNEQEKQDEQRNQSEKSKSGQQDQQKKKNDPNGGNAEPKKSTDGVQGANEQKDKSDSADAKTNSADPGVNKSENLKKDQGADDPKAKGAKDNPGDNGKAGRDKNSAGDPKDKNAGDPKDNNTGDPKDKNGEAGANAEKNRTQPEAGQKSDGSRQKDEPGKNDKGEAKDDPNRQASKDKAAGQQGPKPEKGGAKEQSPQKGGEQAAAKKEEGKDAPPDGKAAAKESSGDKPGDGKDKAGGKTAAKDSSGEKPGQDPMGQRKEGPTQPMGEDQPGQAKAEDGGRHTPQPGDGKSGHPADKAGEDKPKGEERPGQGNAGSNTEAASKEKAGDAKPDASTKRKPGGDDKSAGKPMGDSAESTEPKGNSRDDGKQSQGDQTPQATDKQSATGDKGGKVAKGQPKPDKQATGEPEDDSENRSKQMERVLRLTRDLKSKDKTKREKATSELEHMTADEFEKLVKDYKDLLDEKKSDPERLRKKEADLHAEQKNAGDAKDAGDGRNRPGKDPARKDPTAKAGEQDGSKDGQPMGAGPQKASSKDSAKGQAGNDKSGQPANQGNEPAKNGRPSDNQAAENRKPQDEGGTIPGSVGQGNQEAGRGDQETPEPKPEAGRFRNRAGVLQLEEFKRKVDRNVLKDAKISEEEYRAFLKAYEEMLKNAGPTARKPEDLPAPQAGGTLRSIGARTVAPTGTASDIKPGSQYLPPPRYREAYRKFTLQLPNPENRERK